MSLLKKPPGLGKLRKTFLLIDVDTERKRYFISCKQLLLCGKTRWPLLIFYDGQPKKIERVST